MMQNCLGGQIGRNIQVYIDDVVIITREEEFLISDLAETFDNLSRYKLKLNPTKCSFGVSAGQLLGFLVSARGIEAVTTSNLIQIRSACYVFHRNPRTVVAIYIT
jgi:hypothetical protein